MITIFFRLGLFVFTTIFLTSCSSLDGPAKDSGLARVKLQWIVGTSKYNEMRGNVVSIRDKKGKEIYNIKHRSTFTYTIDIPEGDYSLITTCAPVAYRYENDQNRYKYILSNYNINTKSGDYIRLVPLKERHSAHCTAAPSIKG